MPNSETARSWTWLLGQDGYQRVYVRFWLMTTSVYLLLLALQAYGVAVGLIPSDSALLIRKTALIGVGSFYVVMRSGWSMRWNDPALTAQQMAFAFAMLAMAYVLTPPIRGTLLFVSPLVLMFGAFTLTPRRCRQLGLLAVLSQSVAVALSLSLAPDQSNSHLEIMTLVSCAVVFTMTADMAARLSANRELLRIQKRQLRLALERNELLARQDELTTLPNRRHAMELLQYETRRSQRDRLPPCICLLDIDHFKRINDTYGHAAGDRVLRLLATHGVPALRAPDILARWGGEEFMLIMPETAVSEATHVVDRLRDRLTHSHIWADHPELQVTFSAGIAASLNDEPIEDTIARADAALYRAKEAGRNRTVLA